MGDDRLIKMEISKDGEWQFMGKMSDESLAILCELASVLSDKDVTKETEKLDEQ